MSKHSLILAALLGAALAATPVRANDADKGSTATRHATTDKDGERHEPAEGTQQHKMKTCNVEAGKKGLKGDERRAFMSSCLKQH